MAKFLRVPFYSVGQLTRLWNAYEADAAKDEPKGYQRKIWNRWSVRRLLEKKGLLPPQADEQRGRQRLITFEELHTAWPELVNSMILIDAYAAQAA